MEANYIYRRKFIWTFGQSRFTNWSVPRSSPSAIHVLVDKVALDRSPLSNSDFSLVIIFETFHNQTSPHEVYDWSELPTHDYNVGIFWGRATSDKAFARTQNEDVKFNVV
jgi:hypothetical protein